MPKARLFSPSSTGKVSRDSEASPLEQQRSADTTTRPRTCTTASALAISSCRACVFAYADSQLYRAIPLQLLCRVCHDPAVGTSRTTSGRRCRGDGLLRNLGQSGATSYKPGPFGEPISRWTALIALSFKHPPKTSIGCSYLPFLAALCVATLWVRSRLTRPGRRRRASGPRCGRAGQCLFGTNARQLDRNSWNAREEGAGAIGARYDN